MAFVRKSFSARLPGDTRRDDGSDSSSADRDGEDSEGAGAADSGEDTEEEGEEELIEVHSRPIGARQTTPPALLSRQAAMPLPEPKITPQAKSLSKPVSAFGRPASARPVPAAVTVPSSREAQNQVASTPVVHNHPVSGVSPSVSDVPPEIMAQMEDGERVMAIAVGEWGARIVATNTRLVAYSSSGGDRLHDVPYEHIAGIEVVKEEPATLVVPAVLTLGGVASFMLEQVPLALVLLLAGLAFFFVFRGAKAYIRSSGGDVITLTDALSEPVQDFVKLVRSHRTLTA